MNEVTTLKMQRTTGKKNNFQWQLQLLPTPINLLSPRITHGSTVHGVITQATWLIAISRLAWERVVCDPMRQKRKREKTTGQLSDRQRRLLRYFQ